VKVNIAVINNGTSAWSRQWQEFFYDGATRDAAAQPGFRQAGGGARPARPAREKRPEVPMSSPVPGAEGTVLIDFRVEQEDSVYPMVPAATTSTR
jgi:acetolactate synthase-1/2/3 large subunit